MNQPGRQTRKDRRIAQRQHASPARRRKNRTLKLASKRWWYLSGAVVVTVVAVWIVIQNLSIFGSDVRGGIPGPTGGDRIAQDINTMDGQPAPAFTLANAEGETFDVTPGNGQSIVLVFHMGIT